MFVKVINDSRYDKGEYIINTNNITYISIVNDSFIGSCGKIERTLIIHFIAEQELELSTYDIDKLNKWLELLDKGDVE